MSVLCCNRYSEAVSLYATTRLSIKEICERTGDSFRAFCMYLCRHHRDLVLKRHNLEEAGNVKLRGSKGQATATHFRYHEAVMAAESLEYIEYNISQIAYIFGLNPTGLLNQLRHHYPDILYWRERERSRLNINDNIHRGARAWSREEYAVAVEMLRSTDKTILEAAEFCDVAYTGLREHLYCYHKDVVHLREKKRRAAKVQEKVKGDRTGTWSIHEPTSEKKHKYAEAVELYRTTSMSLEDIAESRGINKLSFGSYLRRWHPELIVERRGFEADTKLSGTKRYKKSTSDKYAEAIDRLKTSDLSTQAVAREFGLNPDVFRLYLKEHEPELASSRGMKTTKDGKRLGVKSSEKYSEAIRLYSTTPESLKSIADRLGLVYVSLGNYIRRNCPEAIVQHRQNTQSLNNLSDKPWTKTPSSVHG